MPWSGSSCSYALLFLFQPWQWLGTNLCRFTDLAHAFLDKRSQSKQFLIPQGLIRCTSTRLVPERCSAPERTAGLMPAVSFLIICWCLVPSLLQERKSKQSKADVPRCKTTCWVCSEALLCGLTSGMELSSRFLTGHWTEPLIKSQSRPNWFSPPKTVCA